MTYLVLCKPAQQDCNKQEATCRDDRPYPVPDLEALVPFWLVLFSGILVYVGLQPSRNTSGQAQP